MSWRPSDGYDPRDNPLDRAEREFFDRPLRAHCMARDHFGMACIVPAGRVHVGLPHLFDGALWCIGCGSVVSCGAGLLRRGIVCEGCLVAAEAHARESRHLAAAWRPREPSRDAARAAAVGRYFGERYAHRASLEAADPGIWEMEPDWFAERYRILLGLRAWPEQAEHALRSGAPPGRRAGRTTRGILRAIARAVIDDAMTIAIDGGASYNNLDYCIDMARRLLRELGLAHIAVASDRGGVAGPRPFVLYTDHYVATRRERLV